jgi:superfamily II DNA or RNA helicase
LSVKHATTVQGVSFKKEPRSGQTQTFEALDPKEERYYQKLSVKLPTGYGKTFTLAGCYSIKKYQGQVNRLLVIFPTDSQLEQFVKDGPIDLDQAGVEGPLQAVDVRYFGLEAIKKHRSNTHQIFVITIQSLIERRGLNNINELLKSGSWMIGVDEHHHYGEKKKWGKVALALNRAFLLVMSATPTRPGEDGAFDAPDIAVTYVYAAEEGAVKRLKAHSYEYRLDLLDQDGEEHTLTTSEIVEQAGGDDPEKIEKLLIEQKMRWSPKYVSPLVSIPIERMLRERVATGYRLQALVSAMCVSHAKLVCEQLRIMFPELTIEWVGTKAGDNKGRDPEDNKRVLGEFCPPKDPDTGKRPPSAIDVLVHVGMAGEGLDSVLVSEIVFLRKASLTIQALQIIGRGARYLPGVVCHTSFDSSSPLSAYTGQRIELAMDMIPPGAEDKDSEDVEPEWPDELPDEPRIEIFNVELIHIDSGDPEVQRMARVMDELHPGSVNLTELKKNLDHPGWQNVIDMYKMMRQREAQEMDPRSIIAQWDQAVEAAVGAVTGLCKKILHDMGVPITAKLIGRIKNEINGKKKYLHGEKAPNLIVLKNHWDWIKKLETELLKQKITDPDKRTLPSWLMDRLDLKSFKRDTYKPRQQDLPL